MDIWEFMRQLKDITAPAVGQAFDETIDMLQRELSPTNTQTNSHQNTQTNTQPHSTGNKAVPPVQQPAPSVRQPAPSVQQANEPTLQPDKHELAVPPVTSLAIPPTPLPAMPSAAQSAAQKPDAPDAAASTSGGTNDEMLDMAIAKDVLARIRMKTSEPALRLKLTDTVPKLCDSKVGGIPYLPADAAVPCDVNGGALRMLAQIDCTALAALPDFPNTGLLQFWIAQDSAWGLNKENGARVIWYETVDPAVTEAQVQAKLDAAPKPADFDDVFPVHGVFGVEVHTEADCMAACDARFVPLFTQMFNAASKAEPIAHPDDLGDEIGEMMWEELSGDGNKIGGYPAFTQGDPRKPDDPRTVLLLQLDSESEDGSEKIMWGDCGIGNFHCTRDALKARDFSNVLYYWDCG